MSRATREFRLEAEQRWPTLHQFLGGYCHQDWDVMHGSPEGAIDAAVADYPLEARQTVLRECAIGMWAKEQSTIPARR